MRPRQACLGIEESQKRSTYEYFASMRPRQACLGILVIQVISPPDTAKLQ